MLVHWIWLVSRPGLHERDQKRIMEAFSDAEDVYFADKDRLEQALDLAPSQLESLMDKDLLEAQSILRKCVDKGISLCTYGDEEYPFRLRHIADPPMVLYYKGTLPDTARVAVVAEVGTRKASLYGLQVARRMGYQIGACGGVLVSGMAKGIDAMAIQGALLSGSPVIGVLGCGADVVYPAVNRSLFADVERCGCLISEFPPETPPYRWNFPRRNRIMSGMSNATLVVEAPVGSGSLITARDALEQGRDVYAVPGNVDTPGFVGSNELLREGAMVATNGWDIMGDYAHLYPETVHPMNEQDWIHGKELEMETASAVAQTTQTPRVKKKTDKKYEKKPIDKQKNSPYDDLKGILPTLPDAQRQILELLTRERLVDEIIEETGMGASKVSATLTVLEIKGMIQRLPGKRVALK